MLTGEVPTREPQRLLPFLLDISRGGGGGCQARPKARLQAACGKQGYGSSRTMVKAITCSEDLRHSIRGVGRLHHRGKAVSLIIAGPGHGGLCLLHPVVWVSPGGRMGPNPCAIPNEITATGGLCEKVTASSRWPQGSTGSSTLSTCLPALSLCSQGGELG